MPLPRRISYTVPPWVDELDDPCAEALAESYFATRALAESKGAAGDGKCRRLLTQADEHVAQVAPGGRQAGAGPDSICETLAKAERLVAHAEACAQRTRRKRRR